MMDDQDTSQPVPGTASQPAYDEIQVEEAIADLRAEQSLAMGFLAGVVAMVIGAATWAAITALTGYQIGFMAVGVGFLVGIAIRKFGKGLDKSFGVMGAVLALLGCCIGNVLAAAAAYSVQENESLFEVLSLFDLETAWEVTVASLDLFTLLFFGLAVVEGFRFSFRPLTDELIQERLQERGVPV